MSAIAIEQDFNDQFTINDDQFIRLSAAETSSNVWDRMSPDDRPVAENILIAAKSDIAFKSSVCFHDMAGFHIDFKQEAKLVVRPTVRPGWLWDSNEIFVVTKSSDASMEFSLTATGENVTLGPHLRALVDWGNSTKFLHESVIHSDLLLKVVQRGSEHLLEGAIAVEDLTNVSLLRELAPKLIVCPLHGRYSKPPLVMACSPDLSLIQSVWFHDAQEDTCPVVLKHVPGSKEAWMEETSRVPHWQQRREEREQLFKRFRFREGRVVEVLELKGTTERGRNRGRGKGGQGQGKWILVPKDIGADHSHGYRDGVDGATIEVVSEMEVVDKAGNVTVNRFGNSMIKVAEGRSNGCDDEGEEEEEEEEGDEEGEGDDDEDDDWDDSARARARVSTAILEVQSSDSDSGSGCGWWSAEPELGPGMGAGGGPRDQSDDDITCTASHQQQQQALTPEQEAERARRVGERRARRQLLRRAADMDECASLTETELLQLEERRRLREAAIARTTRTVGVGRGQGQGQGKARAGANAFLALDDSDSDSDHGEE